METTLHHLQFSFTGIKSAWFYLIIIGIAVLAILFSWLGVKKIAPFKKKTLIFSLRVVSIILITLTIFQPQVERQDFVRSKNKVGLIFDNSRSMTLKDSDSNIQRIEVVKQFIKKIRGILNNWKTVLMWTSSRFLILPKKSPILMRHGYVTDIQQILIRC